MATTRQSPDEASARPALRPRKPTAPVTYDQPLSHEQVARLAYEFWQARGCPHDSAEIDWLRAEQELRARIDEKKLEPAAPRFPKKLAAAPRVLRTPRAAGQKRASTN